VLAKREAQVHEDRRLAVLRAIVEDYVATREPVGSKALVERHNLGVSPATIRNDMAALEEEGLIAQPHTSAGRVPTDMGYRLFVDRLSAVKPLSSAEKRAIETFLADAVDLDDVMVRTVRLLAQVTRQVALVQYPSLARSSVRHIELLHMSTTRVMLILIADSGRVEQRSIDVNGPVTEELVSRLRSRLMMSVVGKRFADVPTALADADREFTADEQPIVNAIITTVLESVVERAEDRVVLGGTSNLTRFGDDYSLVIQPILEALEEQVVLMRLLGEVSVPQSVTVRIGHENPIHGLESTSVVTSGYAIGDEQVARLGILGPTHMDYPGTMSSVQAVAAYLSRILGSA